MKKILAFILVLFAALSAKMAYAGAEEENAAGLLNYLGISIEKSDRITKGEFVENVMKLSGYRDLADDSGKIYVDTVDKAERTAYINAAVEYKIAAPKGNGRFGTDDSITTREAVEIVLNALGYGEYASLTGYVKAANTAKLEYSGNVYLDSAAMGELLLSMLESPRMHTIVSSGHRDYVTEESDTVLSSVFGLEKRSGLVTANAYSTLNGKTEADVSSLEVDYIRYATANNDYATLLGFNIIYYINDDDVICYAQKDNNKNRVLTVEAENVEKISSGYVYFSGENQKKAPVNNTTSVIINGRFHGKYVIPFITLQTLKKSCGSLVLLDNDKDSLYDVIFVEAFETEIISHVDTVGEIIYFKDSGKYIDLTDYRSAELIYNGAPISISELSGNTVASVLKNDGGYIKVYVSDGEISGTVTAYDEDYIYMGNTKYKTIDGLEIALDEKITALADIFGRIVYIESSEENALLGYLIEFAPQNSIGGGWDYRIFTENGEMNIYSSEQKIRVNGVKTEELYDELAAQDETGSLLLNADGSTRYDQLISFVLGSEGEIIKITTANPGYEKNSFSCAYSNEAARLFNESGLIDMQYRYTAQTPVIYVPDDRSDYRYYRIGKASFNNDKQYNMVLYNLDEYYNAGIIVVYEKGLESTVENLSTQTSLDNPILLVDKVAVGTGDDGGDVYIISGIREGKRVSYEVSEEEYVSVHRGDIIRCNYSDNTITAMYVEFCSDTGTMYKSGAAYPGYAEYTNGESLSYAQSLWCYGSVSEMRGDLLAYVKGRTATIRLDKGMHTRVYVYEKANKTARTGSFTELCAGDEICVNVHRGRCFEIVIYR